MLPFERIRAAAARRPALHEQLHAIMAREIVRDQAVMLMLGKMNAEERVAVFLLDILARLRSRGWSGSEAVLRMSRGEIGSYLGLTLETVRRALFLRRQGLIRIRLRHIEVLDAVRLRSITAGAGTALEAALQRSAAISAAAALDGTLPSGHFQLVHDP